MKTVTVYSPTTGRPWQAPESAVAAWERRGWTTSPPDTHPEVTAVSADDESDLTTGVTPDGYDG